MNKNFPGLKKDIKAQDKKANGVLNRTDKKTTINIQTDYVKLKSIKPKRKFKSLQRERKDLNKCQIYGSLLNSNSG